MRLLVTGAAGFIGTHTAIALIRAGHDVVGFDGFQCSKRAALDAVATILGRPVELVEGDIRDGASVRKALAGQDFDAVIHCAGLKSVDESVAHPLRYYDTNVTGSVVLLEAMRECGVRKIVFSSSASVYGAGATSPVIEDAVPCPSNPYGRTKVFIERVLADECAADPTFAASVLRYFNPIGAHASGLIGEDPLGVPANLLPFVAQVASGRHPEVLVRGADWPTPDGTGVRDYLHVEDLAEGHVAAVEELAGRHGYGLWNLGTGTGTSVLEVVAAFSRAIGHEVPYRIVDRRPGDVAVSYADPSRAERDLGWRARRSLDEACRDLWNWQTRNPTGYPA